MSIQINSENFNEEVIESKMPIMVDFFATWCGPCKMLSPIIEQISDEYDGKICVKKVDIDESPDLAQKFEIMSVPMLVFFKDGEVKKRESGFMSKEQLKNIINTTFEL